MNDVSQGFSSLHTFCLPVLQNGELFADGLRHTSFFSAIWLQRPSLRSSWYVDVVPRPVLSLSPDIVGPGGRVRHQIARRAPAITVQFRINGVFAQQLLYQLLGFGS